MLLFLLLPASVLWSSLGGAMFHLLAATGVVLALCDPSQAWQRLRALRRMPLLLMLAVALNLVAVLAWGLRMRELHLMPLLFALPVALAIASVGAAGNRILFAGAATACVLAFVVTLPEWPRADDDPTVGMLNAIVFAQIVLVCAAHTLSGALETRAARSALLLLAAGALGVLAVTMSGTRGAILAVPLLAGVLWAGRARWRAMPPPGRRALALFAALMLIATAGLAVRSGLPERFARIADDTAAYRRGEIATHSIAIRLSLWRASLEIASARPWLGHGPSRFKSALERLQAEGTYPADAPLHAHPHNTLLSILVQYGALGLAVLLAAITLAWRGLAQAPPTTRALGRTLIVMWCLMGLSNDLLAHQNTLRVIALEIALLAALSLRAGPDGARASQSGQATIS